MNSQRYPQGQQNTDKRRSLWQLTLSMLIFGTIGIFRRLIGLPSDVIAFGRGLMGGIFLLLFARLRGKKLAWAAIGRRDLLLLILSGMLIGFNWIALFEAYNYTTVATATLCYYMQPVIVIALSPLVLKERLSGRQLVCALVSVVGMVLVSGVIGGGAAGGSRGILLGLAAAALYAGVVLLNKRITVNSAFEKTILQLFSAAAVMLPYMALTGSLHAYTLSPTELVLFLVVGVVHTGIAYALYFGAIEALPARTCALLSYVDPVTAVLLSALLLHEGMSVSAVIGAVLILDAAVYSEA